MEIYLVLVLDSSREIKGDYSLVPKMDWYPFFSKKTHFIFLYKKNSVYLHYSC